MGQDRSRTSIPSRAIELNSKGPSGVREYTLTPEELEEIRKKYPATKRDKTFKKPVAHNPREDKLLGKKSEEDGSMAKFTMTAEEYFAERQAGKTIAQVAKEQGVSEATIYNHMNKWAGEDKGDTPKETQLLREKEALQPQPPVNLPEMYKKALQEIEELKAALSVTQPVSHDMLKKYKAEAEHWKSQATETVALAGKAAEESTAKIERLQAARRGEAAKSDELREELNRMITERDELQADNDRLNNMIILQAQQTEPEPTDEVHLLDRSIAELTRAKWILDRLSASGE